MLRKRFFVALAATLLLGAGYVWAEGLDVNYGRNLPTVFDEGDKIPALKGKLLKVLRTGVLGPGQSMTVSKAVFENNARCIVVGYGRGQDSDLDIFVNDSNSGQEIGKDVLLDNFPLVQWKSGVGERNVVDIRVANSGKKACSFVLLANY